MNRIVVVASVGLMGLMAIVMLMWQRISVQEPVALPNTPSNVPTGVQEQLKLANFSSQKLGIRFSYQDKIDNETGVVATEMDNKVYVHMSTMPVEQGQYIEVFEKPTNEPLKGSIQRMFLNVTNPEECFVKSSNYKLATNWEIAEIAVPWIEGEGMEEMMPRWERCPKPYTTQNGIAFFAMDKNHPTKLLFFNIGQYGIPAGEGKAWQDTVEVF